MVSFTATGPTFSERDHSPQHQSFLWCYANKFESYVVPGLKSEPGSQQGICPTWRLAVAPIHFYRGTLEQHTDLARGGQQVNSGTSVCFYCVLALNYLPFPEMYLALFNLYYDTKA